MVQEAIGEAPSRIQSEILTDVQKATIGLYKDRSGVQRSLVNLHQRPYAKIILLNITEYYLLNKHLRELHS